MKTMSSSNSDQRLDHLLSAVVNEFQKGSEKNDASERDIKLELEDAELWSKFKELTNEMIVTKTGRYVIHDFSSACEQSCQKVSLSLLC